MSRRTNEAMKWLRRYSAHEPPQARLFCFPYAGGSAGVYRPWRERLSPGLELVAVQPPGREDRLAEPAFDSVSRLVDTLLPLLREWLDRPYVLFGHSMGALLAFATARRAMACGLRSPALLVVSGCPAPGYELKGQKLGHLDDEAFFRELEQMGGTPPAFFEHPELMELMGPGLRADFLMCERFREESHAAIEVPIEAFGGRIDEDVPESVLAHWAEYTQCSFSYRLFGGDHFFIHGCGDEVARALDQVALAALGSGDRQGGESR